MRRRAIFALLALAGCAAEAPNGLGSARLPRDATEGAGDPTRAAVSRADFALAVPERLAGRAGDAARVIADMEFLAVQLPQDPNFQQRDPLLPGQLAQARQEWRQALGISPSQPVQPLIDGLYAFWRASQAQQGQAQQGMAAARAALPAGLLSTAGVARLNALAPLPETGRAASAAARMLFQGPTPSGRRRL